MADHAAEGDNNDVAFVYMGGDQEVPFDVTHAIVDRSVDTIRRRAFYNCRHLVSTEMHDGVKIIEEEAFQHCESLKRIHLLGVKVIEEGAFADCTALEDVEFGNELDKIGWEAFARTSLRKIKIPKVRAIEANAFVNCEQLTEAAHLSSEDLESVEYGAFMYCLRLRRIAIPLKNDILDDCAFSDCDNLTQVDLVGGIHKTISSLLLDSWKNEMNDEIDSINRDLPNIHYDKTFVIRRWMIRVIRRIEHYKSEHYALLKNNMTQLELALWDANLLNVDSASRHEARVTCGANIIIPHVLSFLNDADVFPLLDYDQQHKGSRC